MSISQTVIDTLNNPPLPTDTPENFNNKAFAMAATLAPMCEQLNETAAAMDLNATSSVSGTTLTIGTGSKTLTVEANKSYQIGMTVKVAETLDGTKWMAGDVTAYNSTTGSLTVVVSKTNGSGTANAWTISLSALETLSDGSVTAAKLAYDAINGQTAETAPALDDEILLGDLSATTLRKMTLSNMLKVINLLTTDSSPDPANDYVMTYEASSSSVKKVLLSVLVPDPNAGQTTQVLTGSRAFATTYTNSTGKPIKVSIVISHGAVNSQTTFYKDGIQFAGTFDDGSRRQQIYAEIPNGSTYRITNDSGSPSISLWSETR